MEYTSKNSLIYKNHLYRLSLISFVTVAIWIGMDIYRANQPKDQPVILAKQTEPLNPNLNMDTIESLSTRIHISDQDKLRLQQAYAQGLIAFPSPSPTKSVTAPQPTPSQVASPSAVTFP